MLLLKWGLCPQAPAVPVGINPTYTSSLVPLALRSGGAGGAALSCLWYNVVAKAYFCSLCAKFFDAFEAVAHVFVFCDKFVQYSGVCF